MIGHLPLWIVVAVWWLQTRSQPAMGIMQIAVMLRLLDDVYRCLPLPRGRLQSWLVTRIILWLDAERSCLIALQRIGPVVVGVTGAHAESVGPK